MSGGVDSSVAALLLKERGYDCTGITMKLFSNADNGLELEDARSLAGRLGIPHFVFDVSREFEERVIDKFIAEYLAGRTPNPCIDCNRCVKFGHLLDYVLAADHEHMATGHYARIERDSSRRYLLRKAADGSKDQSYVLYSMTQKALARTLFPLGDLRKSEVREIAERHGFGNMSKQESQDICFVPNGNYGDFIAARSGRSFNGGNFLDESGKVIGTHEGFVRYTIGQRRGLGMGFSKRKFVVAKDCGCNTVTLGDKDSLYVKSLYADGINLIATAAFSGTVRVNARIRYRKDSAPAIVEMVGDDVIRVEFDAPQLSVTPGQAIVLYDGDIVFGGGTIRETRKK